LVVAANRDEFHQRPTAAAAFWPASPDLLAGRDLEAGGTWLGVTRQGKFAAITNYREPQHPEGPMRHSRGHLVRDYLAGRETAADYAASLAARGQDYRGFNLLLGEPGALLHVSNRSDGIIEVSGGCHGLSNHLLDTDWPKVHWGRARLDALLEKDQVRPEALLELLANRNILPGDEPPGADLELSPERITRQAFIVSPEYGTRSSTVLLIDRDGEAVFVERQFDSAGAPSGTQSYQFELARGFA
jgi:uncharacterized protein with NRDE domain